VTGELEALAGWMDVVTDSVPVQGSELELTGEVSLGAAADDAAVDGGGCGGLLQV